MPITRNLRALADLRWNRVERACAPLVLAFLAHAWYLAGALYALGRPDRGRLVNVPLLQAQPPLLVAFMAGALLLLGLGLYLRRHWPDLLAFQYVTALYYMLTMLWAGYLVGTLGFASGVVLMGGVLTGYILLERRVIRTVAVAGSLLLLGLNLASAAGRLPYAPLLPSPVDASGRLFWVSAAFYLAAPHLVVCLSATVFMLSRWQRREQAALRLSLTDVLTGLHNRRSILERLQAALADAHRREPALAVALLDLDHFKTVNDRYGHPAGDGVLQAAAAALQACLQPGEALGRFGGEEFLLLLPGLGEAEALARCEQCRQQLAALSLRAENGEPIPVSGSFGLAWCAAPASVSAERLLQVADAALYRAKQAGRNRVVAGLAAAEEGEAAAPGRLLRSGGRRRSRSARFLRLLRDFLGGWQRWTPVEKQMFHLGLSVLLFGNFMLWAGCMFLLNDRDALVDMSLQMPMLAVMGAINLGYLLLIAAGLLVRRRWPDSRLYQIVSQQYFALSLIGVGHVVGMLSFATGIMLVSVPLVGFMYFERRLVWWSLSTPFLFTVLLGYASALGYLPYAPALAAGTDHYQPHSLFWVLSFYHFTWSTMAVVVLLADRTFGRWRQRGREVRDLGRTDVLTRVHNRRNILELAGQAMARAQRRGRPLCLVLLDLDYFKKINDTWGHPVGDRVLQQAARVLQATVREGDAVGRYGGEEFLLLLPDTPLDGAAALVERCRAALAATTITADNGDRFNISASFGVAGSECRSGLDLEALIKAADDALYRAKEAGRNRVEVEALAV